MSASSSFRKAFLHQLLLVCHGDFTPQNLARHCGGQSTRLSVDFRHGRSLEENRGIVATCGSIHQEVLDAVRAARR